MPPSNLTSDWTIYARIDGKSGKTIWAKSPQFNLTFGYYQIVMNGKIDSNDNLWSSIYLTQATDTRSVIIKYDKDGIIANIFIVGKLLNSKEYNLYKLEVVQIQIISLENIIFLSKYTACSFDVNFTLMLYALKLK